MRLYEVTQQPRYMALVNYFVEQRGAQPISMTKSTKSAAKPLTGILTVRHGW
jgi:DUF1680 family protein